jgi:Fe-S cluster biogenesis protein NfuA
MITREQIESVLERVRPFLRADGGDVQVVRVQGNTADLRLLGRCAGCPSAQMTLYLGIETALRRAIPEFDAVRVV